MMTASRALQSLVVLGFVGSLSLAATDASAQDTLPPLPGPGQPSLPASAPGTPPPAADPQAPAAPPSTPPAAPAQAAATDSPYPVPAGCVPGKDQAGNDVLYCTRNPAGGDASAAPPPATTREWYGWQTLLVDGGMIALTIAAGSAESGEMAAIAGLGYLFAPGVVHFAHGNVGAGFGSMGLRAGLPLGGFFTGFLLGAGLASGGSEPVIVGLAAGVLGAGLGIIGAIVLDAALLAYEKKPVVATPTGAGSFVRVGSLRAERPAAPWFTLRPTGGVTPVGGHVGGHVGLAGTF